MKFYLGTHIESWLKRVSIPLFVSHRRLKGYKKMPVARGPWCLDSGGFTELSMFGKWQTTPTEYLDSVLRYADEIGNLEWAAPQDWMCEPQIINSTGLSVAEHQERSVENFLLLREQSPLFIPVLQGWTLDDYWECVTLYLQAGVDLFSEPIVGLGTVCRRQATDEVSGLICELAESGLSLHGFGIKMLGLKKVGHVLKSADSMAWSYNARKNPPLPGHKHPHCNNCIVWAAKWRAKALATIQKGE